MAKAEAKPEAKVEEAAPKKGGKKILIILLAFVLIILMGGGAGAYFLLKGSDEAVDEDGEEEVVEKPKKKDKKNVEPEKPPAFAALEPFVVNLQQQQNGGQYLRIEFSLEVEDELEAERVKGYIPKIRSHVMLLLSDQKTSELLTKEGKEVLAEDIRKLVNAVLEPDNKKQDTPVKEVLFTAFIIQ